MTKTHHIVALKGREEGREIASSLFTQAQPDEHFRAMMVTVGPLDKKP